MITCLHLEAKECQQLDWVQEDSRTQGGNWIWFPGTGKHKTLSKATLYAEGRALDYLTSECGLTHTETKFHEKCVEKDSQGYFNVYVRASITHRQCDQAKYGSPELKEKIKSFALNQKLEAYKAFITNSFLDTRKCNASDVDGCFTQANKEFKMNNFALAAAYAKRACEYGDKYSCGFLGYLYFEMGDVYRGKKLMRKGCDNGFDHYCRVLDLT